MIFPTKCKTKLNDIRLGRQMSMRKCQHRYRHKQKERHQNYGKLHHNPITKVA